MKYALIQNSIISEIFETDGDITRMFHPDLIWLNISKINPEPQEGWTATQTGDRWIFEELFVAPPTNEQLKAEAIAQRDFLLREAEGETAGMADAFIAGLLEEEDIKKFISFASYKLKLNKIDHQKGFPEKIDWPKLPE